MKNLIHAGVIKLAATPWGAGVMSHTAHHLDRLVLRQTEGRHSLSSWLSGLPIIALTTTGAKSGQPRTVPLVAVPDGDALIVIASNWGQAHYPAWYHNLRAHPHVQVTHDGQTNPYSAEELSGAERERCRQKAEQVYFGYALYATRTQGRPIPVIRLTRDTDAPGELSSDASSPT